MCPISLRLTLRSFPGEPMVLSSMATVSGTTSLSSRRTLMNLVSHTELTPLSFLERSARVFPDKTAVIYGKRRLTYRELEEEATRVAHALRASGIQPGDRVAYLMPNVPEMLVAQFAVPLAGAVLVSVNTRLSDEEIAYILHHSGAKMLVTDSNFLPQVASAVHNVPTITEVVVFEDAEAGEAADEQTYTHALAMTRARMVRYGEFAGRQSS